jgi:hypothetical protein
VVFGMPAEAIKLGAADDVMPLGGIAAWLRQAARPLRGEDEGWRMDGGRRSSRWFAHKKASTH